MFTAIRGSEWSSWSMTSRPLDRVDFEESIEIMVVSKGRGILGGWGQQDYSIARAAGRLRSLPVTVQTSGELNALDATP